MVVSAGLGVSIPTADDVKARLGGTEVLRIRNDAVILTPYLAGLWTPNDHLFSQGWLGFGLDPNGNAVQTNFTGQGLGSIGRLYDPTTLQCDLQFGFWLIHPCATKGSALRGLAPFVEYHMSQQIENHGTLTQGGVNVTDNIGRVSDSAVSAGAAIQLYDNINLMVGATAPLGNDRDRFSDWQVGVRLNYFFGPTGRARANLY